MSTETNSRGAPYDGQLFELYTKYVREPESKMDVYGYTLLVTGYLLAIGGMLVYLLGPSGTGAATDTVYLVRKIAVLLAAPGLLLSLLGIVSLLPVTNRSLYAAVTGTVVGLAAVVMFGMYYPRNWHFGTPSYSGQIIAVYTAGVAVVAGVVIMVPVVTGERSYFSETTVGHEYEHPDIALGKTDRGGLFAVFKRNTEWSWRFIDQNAVAGSTGSFLSRLEAEERVDAVKEQVADASLLEIKHAAFRLYEGGDGQWQWHLLRDDGGAVAEGGRDFESRDTAESAINVIKDHGPDADVIVRDEAAFDVQQRGSDFVWRLVDEDRNPLAEGVETQNDRSGVRADIDAFRERVGEATELAVDAYGVELRSADDGWRWHLRDEAHRRLASSAGAYESKGVAEEAVYDLLERVERASTVVAGQPTYDVYQTGSDWAWRLVDETGSPVARGVETVGDAETAAAGARELQSHAGSAEVVEIEDLEFETYRRDGAWHWRLVDSERAVHARSTDAYESDEEATAVVERVRSEAPEADLIEFDTAAFQVYEAEGGAWRWRLIDEDGTVLADSGQGEYESKDDAMSAMMTLQENAPDAEHLEIENAAFELFQDDGGWGWRLVDDIGDTIADSARRYDSEEAARQAMDALVGSVSDVGERRMRDGIFQVYADGDDEWWWRFVRPDGRIVAESPTEFGTRHQAEAAVESLAADATDAPVATVGSLAVRLDPDDWHWELVDADRESVATGHVTYEDREAVAAAVSDLQSSAADATVYEIRDAAFDCYRTDDGWTWRLVDADHETLARASTTYDGREAVESAVGLVSRLAPDADVLDYDDVAFELQEADGGWTWRLVDEEQRVVGAAAGYHESQAAAERDIEAAREAFGDASVLEIDSAAFEFHRTDEGWTWRLVDDHGEELAESIATFQSRVEAQEDLSTIKSLGPDAWVSTAE
ncbi:DUF1508 domain-containing protein [Halosimplex aquaticum]|uniref:DUF1508 domain-containing protein n=1 Tax=Halosimplex aquaticum TaxID=3026162 RepID=A0ABD5Y373_9EURY|nr:DUF1508 domain-containing protein [Halosimplex aquaticum]